MKRRISIEIKSREIKEEEKKFKNYVVSQNGFFLDLYNVDPIMILI